LYPLLQTFEYNHRDAHLALKNGCRCTEYSHSLTENKDNSNGAHIEKNERLEILAILMLWLLSTPLDENSEDDCIAMENFNPQPNILTTDMKSLLEIIGNSDKCAKKTGALGEMLMHVVIAYHLKLKCVKNGAKNGVIPFIINVNDDYYCGTFVHKLIELFYLEGKLFKYA